MDQDLIDAFNYVKDDLNDSVNRSKHADKRINKLERQVADLILDKKRTTKKGKITGKTYITLNGKVKAIAEHLGISFEAEPAKLTRATVKVVKAKKGAK